MFTQTNLKIYIYLAILEVLERLFRFWDFCRHLNIMSATEYNFVCGANMTEFFFFLNN